MKRFFAVLSSLLVLPTFAEVAPVYYDEIVEYTDEMIDAIDNTSETQDVAQPAARTNTRSTTTSRSGATRTTADTRKTTNRATVSRTAVTPTRQTAQRSTVSRSGTTTRSRQTAQQTSPAVRARTSVGKNGAVAYTNKANTVGYVTRLNDSGNSLYNPTSDTGSSSRVGVTSQRRVSATRLSSATPVITEQDIQTTTSNLDAIAQLTDYCKAQYAACMDNYCNVLDDNQGRCSCSKNLKNYQKVEEALAAASSDFQDTVNKIKYIGLTADQVTSLFAETEAEVALSSNKDQSKMNSSLDAIKRKIIDATSPTSSSSYVSGTGVSMDLSGLLDFDLSSAFDLSSFLNTGTKSNTTSVTNQRGEQLYKTAAARCKSTVLDSCTAQGIEANIITNSYDLEIDKQCMAYERNLNDANAEMKENVRNAAIILQQARLMLAQNKNSYDFRGCVAAIDSCMQDEYVCGADYELCLDPTGKYISGGEIVKGGTPGMPGGTVVNTHLMANCSTAQGATPACTTNEEPFDTWYSHGMYDLYAAWNYKNSGADYNAWGGGKDENLNGYIDYQLNQWKSNYNRPASQNGSDIATFLLQKVGYIDNNDKVQGMCASAMQQCQEYTFDTSNSKKVYKPNNDVVRQYLYTVLNKIKNQQDTILSDYAEDCQSEVSSCLSSNNYDDKKPDSSASKAAMNACRTEIQTCMSVSGSKPTDSGQFTLRAMADWVKLFTLICDENYYLEEENGNVSCKPCGTLPVLKIVGDQFTPNGTRTVPAVAPRGSLSCTCDTDAGYTLRTYVDTNNETQRGCYKEEETPTAQYNI